MTRIIFLTAYAVITAAALAFHVMGVLWDKTMTFGALVWGLLRWPPLRWLIVVGWLWVGWHVFVRVDR